MFIGSSDVDLQKIARLAREPEKLRDYSDSLIPDEFKHLRLLRENQLYYILLQLRSIKTVPWDIKRDTIDLLMSGLRITGYADVIIEVKQIYPFVDMDIVNKYIDVLINEEIKESSHGR